jgi:hypothetical protein
MKFNLLTYLTSSELKKQSKKNFLVCFSGLLADPLKKHTLICFKLFLIFIVSKYGPQYKSYCALNTNEEGNE